MIAPDPLHRSGRAELPHPAPTLGEDAQVHERIRMTDRSPRKPAHNIALHAVPLQVVTLATSLPLSGIGNRQDGNGERDRTETEGGWQDMSDSAVRDKPLLAYGLARNRRSRKRPSEPSVHLQRLRLSGGVAYARTRAKWV